MKRYEKLALTLDAIRNCVKVGNEVWKDRHEDTLDAIMRETAPSGSGIDRGTAIDFDACTPDKIVFTADFHHMTDHGYDGWTEHTITVKPSLAFGITLRISGRDRNSIKDYLHDVYHHWLTEEEVPLPTRAELAAVPA